MTIHSPFMFIFGATIIGWLLPEVLAAINKAPAPVSMNILSAVAACLIASSVV